MKAVHWRNTNGAALLRLQIPGRIITDHRYNQVLAVILSLGWVAIWQKVASVSLDAEEERPMPIALTGNGTPIQPSHPEPLVLTGAWVAEAVVRVALSLTSR